MGTPTTIIEKSGNRQVIVGYKKPDLAKALGI
jgi:hypothetical protein